MLVLLLMLGTLLPQTALAATTYYVDVTITGPDADGVERTLSASSSRYGTMDTPLAAELASVVDSAYHEMETVFSGTGLRNIVDTGAQAFREGESAWNLYVEKYYDSVDSSFKDTLKSLSSTFSNLTVDRVNRVTYRDNGRLYTVTVTLKAYTTGSDSGVNPPSLPHPTGTRSLWSLCRTTRCARTRIPCPRVRPPSSGTAPRRTAMSSPIWRSRM